MFNAGPIFFARCQGEESDPESDWGFFNTKRDDDSSGEDEAARRVSQTDIECLFE